MSRLNRRECWSIVCVSLLLAAACHAQPQPQNPGPHPPPSLAGATVPPVVERISGLDLVPSFVIDESAAVRLGKALFWDMQAGSDGQACASCHFHAGADSRTKNQLSPGLNGGNATFDTTRTGGAGPNHDLVPGDYPFHLLADPTDRASAVLFDADDVTSSQGVYPTIFTDIVPGSVTESCLNEGGGLGDPVGFHVGAVNVRRVEPRNTPSVINAVFNHRNFWDGRANNIFNGVDPFGRRNTSARVLEVQPDSSVLPVAVEYTNSSLASQAVGPPLSGFEMSCAGRSFPKLGKKLLSLSPLALQHVHANDSVLGLPLSQFPATGIAATYAGMIQAAFDSRFWNSNRLFDIDQNEIGSGAPANTDQFTLMESNFAMFWGLSIQLYESTLVSDQAPYDQGNLTQLQEEGLKVFMTQGGCINCHDTALFSNAAVAALILNEPAGGPIESMLLDQQSIDHVLTGTLEIPLTLGGGISWLISMQAQGTPIATEDPRTPSPASGTITFTLIVSGGPSHVIEYAVTSMLLDPDGLITTRDIEIKVVPITLLGSAPITVRVVVDAAGCHVCFTSDGSHEVLIDTDAPADSFTLMGPALYDRGFYNIGVRPTREDLGVGGSGPFGHPLSFARQHIQMLMGVSVPDPLQTNAVLVESVARSLTDVVPTFGLAHQVNNAADLPRRARPVGQLFGPPDPMTLAGMGVVTDGAFKVPSLRNVELTGPFFHNGGQASLEQVVEFYNRGADFVVANASDANPLIFPLRLTAAQKTALVAFLKSLTDNRVRNESAPFDHPELLVPNGHSGTSLAVVDADGDGRADDDVIIPAGSFIVLPAVGAGGLSAEGLPPIGSYLGL